MKSRILLFIMAAIGIVFQSCQPANRADETADTTAAIDHTAVDSPKVPDSAVSQNGIQTSMFIEKVALGGMMEIELGKLAGEKARNFKVKEFGKQMEQDHTKIAASLKELSAAKGLKLPASLSEADLQQIQKMNKMGTDRFENTYMKMMVKDHEKDIELFKAAANSTDVVIAGFARKFLPVLESHRKKALEILVHLKTEADKSLVPILP